jgi:hypothetical protein
MLLTTITISGYRRFKDPTKINFDGKLIALVRRTRFTGHLVGERGDHAMAA